MPESPTKHMSCSSASEVYAAGSALPQSRRADAITRSALSASILLSAIICARISSVSGTMPPSDKYVVHRDKITSGAPLVCCIYADLLRTTTVIILRVESNGISPTRGRDCANLLVVKPSFAASATSAASVGSPCASFLSSSQTASLASAIVRKCAVRLPHTRSTTVILFCVSVPVLSEQITCVQPSVSTAESLRIMACFLLILVTPIESTMVTTAAKPSGIAATASDTAIIKVERTRPMSDKNARPCLSSVTPKITAQITTTHMVSVCESSVSFF